MAKKLLEAISPAQRTFTIFMGDFNFVTDKNDRREKGSEEGAGNDNDRIEAEIFSARANTAGLHEIEQGLSTHMSGTTISRLDRCYTNGHIADQLNWRQSCDALAWQPQLSHHRPISYRKIAPPKKEGNAKPIPGWVTTKEDWGKRVKLEIQFRTNR